MYRGSPSWKEYIVVLTFPLSKTPWVAMFVPKAIPSNLVALLLLLATRLQFPEVFIYNKSPKFVDPTDVPAK